MVSMLANQGHIDGQERQQAVERDAGQQGAADEAGAADHHQHEDRAAR